jgi:hypothetical protein
MSRDQKEKLESITRKLKKLEHLSDISELQSISGNEKEQKSHTTTSQHYPKSDIHSRENRGEYRGENRGENVNVTKRDYNREYINNHSPISHKQRDNKKYKSQCYYKSYDNDYKPKIKDYDDCYFRKFKDTDVSLPKYPSCCPPVPPTPDCDLSFDCDNFNKLQNK